MGNSTKRVAVTEGPAISNVTAGDKFDIDKFMGGTEGVWYEIAHINNPVQKECDNVIHAIRNSPYGLVIFTSCYGGEGNKLKFVQQGKLLVPNPNDPSKMILQYDAWLNNKGVEFWVYDTDHTTYSLCGNPSGLAWILSRQPTMSFCTFQKIAAKMKTLGFHTDSDTLKIDINSLSRCTGSDK